MPEAIEVSLLLDSLCSVWLRKYPAPGLRHVAEFFQTNKLLKHNIYLYLKPQKNFGLIYSVKMTHTETVTETFLKYFVLI